MLQAGVREDDMPTGRFIRIVYDSVQCQREQKTTTRSHPNVGALVGAEYRSDDKIATQEAISIRPMHSSKSHLVLSRSHFLGRSLNSGFG